MKIPGTKYFFLCIKDNKIFLEYKISGRKPEGRRYWSVPPKYRKITRIIKDNKFKLDGEVYDIKDLMLD